MSEHKKTENKGNDRDEKLLTIADVAEMLRVSPKTIYNWAYRNLIPRIKLGRGLLRFRRADILLWIEAGAVS